MKRKLPTDGQEPSLWRLQEGSSRNYGSNTGYLARFVAESVEKPIEKASTVSHFEGKRFAKTES